MERYYWRTVNVIGWPLAGVAVAHGLFGQSIPAYIICALLALPIGVLMPMPVAGRGRPDA